MPPSPGRGRAPAVSSYVCPLWAQGAPGPSWPLEPFPATLPPSLQPWSLLGLAEATALDAVLRSRGAWTVLTFRLVALALWVQTADLGCWEAPGMPRGAGGRPCAWLCWAPCSQTWLCLWSSFLLAPGRGHCWPLPPSEGPAEAPPLQPRDFRARPECVLGLRSPGMPYGLAPIPGGWPLTAPFELSPFCLLAATPSSERLLRGFCPLFFTKFLFFSFL